MMALIYRTLCVILAAALALVLVYYQGLPILGDVWFVNKIPIIGELAEGKVSRTARIAADEARKGYVQEATVTALRAQLAEERRQREAGDRAIADFRMKLQEAERLDQQQTEENEKRIAEYEQALKEAGRSCLLDRADVDFLLRHH